MASPCPICGNQPEIDYGLVDAPHDRPFLRCPTVLISGDLTVSCPVYADGFDGWELVCQTAKNHRGL